jgi:toxin CcdB
MARFAVYETKAGQKLVDCQADLLSYLDSRLVVPLIPPDTGLRAVARLNPAFQLEGASFIFFTQYATTMPVRELGKKIASLAEHDYEISAALDMLLIGF